MPDSLPVFIELIPDPDVGGFTACLPDILAYGEGETQEAAIADLKEALRTYIETVGLDEACPSSSHWLKGRVGLCGSAIASLRYTEEYGNEPRAGPSRIR